MDNMEVRVHEEINSYKEKFYGFTFRQIVSIVLVLIFDVPMYIVLRKYISEDILQFIVILVSAPILSIGWLTIQQLPFEKFLRFFFREYFDFYRPLEYKTDKEVRDQKAYIESLSRKERKKYLKQLNKENKEKIAKENEIKKEKEQEIIEEEVKNAEKDFINLGDDFDPSSVSPDISSVEKVGENKEEKDSSSHVTSTMTRKEIKKMKKEEKIRKKQEAKEAKIRAKEEAKQRKIDARNEKEMKKLRKQEEKLKVQMEKINKKG